MHRWQTSILMILILVRFRSRRPPRRRLLAPKTSRIQEAIDASEIGDEIVVLNSTYGENLVVDRPIALRGDGMPVVRRLQRIRSHHNDKCQRRRPGRVHHRRMHQRLLRFGLGPLLSDGSRILNNTIYGSSSHGICVLNSTDHLISKNRIHDNSKAGIRLAGVNDSSIVKNDISKNAYGVFIESSHDGWVLNSDVWGNGADGITIASSSGNELTSNSIHSNADNGIYLTDSYNNILVGNRIRDCINSGIDVFPVLRHHDRLERHRGCDGMGINVDSGDNNVMAWNFLIE